MDLRYCDQFVHVALVDNIRARLLGPIQMTFSAHSVRGDSICVMNGRNQGKRVEGGSREDDV